MDQDERPISDNYEDAPLSDPVGNGPDIGCVVELAAQVRSELSKVIIGQDVFIEQMVVALLCGGHVLVEGVPGIAKTLTAKLLARSLRMEFSRIQFTPDLMPTDVLGTNIFNLKTTEFQFNPGPIFANVVLIDEINRAPAKTQSALFEVMEELQVTVDGHTYPLQPPFFVLATQNPIEQEGTYKLPEAQLDRFLFRIRITYPDLEQEKLILRRFREDFRLTDFGGVQPVVSREALQAAKDTVEKVLIREELLDYIAILVNRTRNHPDLFLGASPRASLSILKAAKALAAIRSRAFVTPDDIREVSLPVLNHRILLTPEREMEGMDPAEVISEIIQGVEVPR